MGTGPKKWTEDVLEYRHSIGHGVGEGKNYWPYFFVQEFSSRGTQTRIPDLLVGRTIHTHSYIELGMHKWHEFNGYADYQENFPVEREITRAIAQQLGVRHPTYPKTRTDKVLTIDAVVTPAAHMHIKRCGWDAKEEEALDDPEVQVELSIKREACRLMGMDYDLFTWQTVSRTIVNNIDLLRGALPHDGEVSEDLRTLTANKPRMLKALDEATVVMSITDFCEAYDKHHSLPEGTGLRVYYNLAYEKRVAVKLDVEFFELQHIPHNDRR
ncbi:TnsA endonuclease N-terminal domain-containing protein [Variovorax sp. J22R24]|uniref:TnsA endonuclease N-terminal domain-containing protein n=1 Tax=Variovorax gracilis TaxID=3053502 RepID=UPI002576C74F|nr:TnsA endonuclease N-terminal domain-containing protein [Variovorax sp. J22R24]MDM0110295.1 TnsA endonuclease N-terminal domain-containing protein [Variovorax sp. J22R24]